MEPVSDILYPVVSELEQNDSFRENSGNNNTNTTPERAVAVFSASFYWRDVLKNVLPPGKQGLIIVIENPCTASFTYQVE
jgi:hypothetical protein